MKGDRTGTRAAVEAATHAIWGHATRDVTGRIDYPSAVRLARRAVRAATPWVERAVRAQIVREMQDAAAGDVAWLAAAPEGPVHVARRVGAEDAWRSAVRIATGSAAPAAPSPIGTTHPTPTTRSTS